MNGPLYWLAINLLVFWLLIGGLAILIVLGASKLKRDVEQFLDGPAFGRDYDDGSTQERSSQETDHAA